MKRFIIDSFRVMANIKKTDIDPTNSLNITKISSESLVSVDKTVIVFQQKQPVPVDQIPPEKHDTLVQSIHAANEPINVEKDVVPVIVDPMAAKEENNEHLPSSTTSSRTSLNKPQQSSLFAIVSSFKNHYISKLTKTSASFLKAVPLPYHSDAILKIKPPNVVLPSFEKELLSDNSVRALSFSQQGLQLLLHSLSAWFHKTTHGNKNSVLNKLIDTPLDVKSIVVVVLAEVSGIHGWFPTKLLQRVVGEPTGTSVRFAEKMRESVKLYYAQKYNIQLADDVITSIPVDAEGAIEYRVDCLFNELFKRRDALAEANVIFFATHSQGTPVSVMLIDKLISESLINPGWQKIGVLCMAGIAHGPFPSLKSNVLVQYVEQDAARQLFDFNFPSSSISKTYQAALINILKQDVRITAIGSWYDQVVPVFVSFLSFTNKSVSLIYSCSSPNAFYVAVFDIQLYSSVMHGFEHPNIYRAIYIEGADYFPDFLSRLVVYCLKLRNLGIGDHDLIVHLSDSIAGSLYGFGTKGHSTLYEELNTYTLAVAWTLSGKKPEKIITSGIKNTVHSIWDTITPYIPFFTSSPSLKNTHEKIVKQFVAPQKHNPYYLPWAMSHLLSDPRIQHNLLLKQELVELLEMFTKWYPTKPSEKELKYRLEPIKSKL